MDSTTMIVTLITYALVGGAGWLVRHLMTAGTAPGPAVPVIPGPAPAPSGASIRDRILAAVEAQIEAELQQVLDNATHRILPAPEPPAPAPSAPAAPKP